jgi:TPR repeat protein
LTPLADPHLITIILAAAMAVIIRPRPARAQDVDTPGGLRLVVDSLPKVLRALQVVGVAPVEALKGVRVDVYGSTVFNFDAILSPGLAPAYEKARGALDAGPLMAELLAPIRQGVDRGEPTMAFLLAHLHRHGHGVPKDFDEAYRLTRQAAEAGDLVAAASLGDMLSRGLGTLPDFGEAVVWLRRALPLGATKTRLGLWHARVYRPDLVSQAEAVESLIFAASRGDALARAVKDEGVVEQNYTIDDWRLEARDGEPSSSFILGQLLLFGPPGDRDEAEGLAAIHQAARGRDDRAARLLSRLYREGAHGLPRDLAEADKWALATKRFEDERLGSSPRPGAPGSPGSVTSGRKAGGAGQASQRKNSRKAKKPRRRS